MLFLIVISPLLGFISGGIFGRFLNKGVCYTTTFSIIISFFFSALLLKDIISTGDFYTTNISKWIYSGVLEVDWCFRFDSLTSIMLVIVTFVSMLIHLYSTEYMESDPHLLRFMSYLSLFTFFMLILITGNNFLQMFVGWEGVGLSSYLLINFWFTRIQANKAAIKAMLVNRVGDFALLLAIFTIFFAFNSVDYDVIFVLATTLSNSFISLNDLKIPIIDLICLLLFVGAMGKSAQIGLHTWLPDAMEGPTPVSALIHAATMVTAGVFLISRCSYLYELSPFVLNIIVVTGACTAFFAATTGLFQNDIKKVIAYSTCSQLGYMMFACGLSGYEVGMFHLSNHAFFKALLFLGAGSVIHALLDEQDMRKMGGLKRLLPLSYSIMLIGSLALIGFPFLAGFYSKDVILEVSYASFTTVGHFSFVLGCLAAFCTAFYSTRLLFLIFLSNPNGDKKSIINAHEGSWKLTLPLFVLSLLSILVGSVSRELFIGFGTDFWGSSIFISQSNYYLTDIEFLDLEKKSLPLILTAIGVFLAFLIYRFKTEDIFFIKYDSKLYRSLHSFFNKKWYFDKIYNQMLTQPILELSYSYFYQIIDRGFIEKFGPLGITSVIYVVSEHIKFYQNGYVTNYLFRILISLLLFILLSVEQFTMLSILFVAYLSLFKASQKY